MIINIKKLPVKFVKELKSCGSNNIMYKASAMLKYDSKNKANNQYINLVFFYKESGLGGDLVLTNVEADLTIDTYNNKPQLFVKKWDFLPINVVNNLSEALDKADIKITERSPHTTDDLIALLNGGNDNE